MIILIDGYNVLKRKGSHSFIDEQERLHFINELSRYRKRKKHTIVLVFDGGPCTWPSKEVIAKVKVIYSGAKRTADVVIMDYIEDHHTKDLLLISSDAELAHFAGKFDVVTLGSQDFYTILQEALQSAGDTEQMDDQDIEIDESIEDLDALMEAASDVVPQKPDDRAPRELPASVRTVSKRERALLKKLQKL